MFNDHNNTAHPFPSPSCVRYLWMLDKGSSSMRKLSASWKYMLVLASFRRYRSRALYPSLRLKNGERARRGRQRERDAAYTDVRILHKRTKVILLQDRRQSHVISLGEFVVLGAYSTISSLSSWKCGISRILLIILYVMFYLFSFAKFTS